MSPALRQLLADIAARPEAFDLFQALRRIEAISPGPQRLGESTRPSQDPIRIGQPPLLAFAPRPVAGVAAVGDPEEEGQTHRLETYAFGLFGPNGPLPLHLTEYAFSRLHNAGDATMARFADMFHHRMASLFYRAWAESEPVVSHDRPQQDRFGVQLASLAGFGMPSMRGRDEMPDLAKLHFTGRLGAHSPNADGLQAILASFFETAIQIVEFVPVWVELPSDTLCLLGRRSLNGTGKLGHTLTIGAKLRVFHHRFRIVVGPLRLASYERLLPGGAGLKKLVAIVQNYIGDELGFEINLVLRHEDVRSLRLGANGKLGWTGWLGKRKPGSHARDLIKTASAKL